MNKKEVWKKIEKKFKNVKSIDVTTREGYDEFCRNYRPFPRKKRERPKCRFCGGPTRPLNTNMVIGPGYNEWNYVCKNCGRIQ